MTSSQKDPLTRITVNLIPRADAALTLSQQLTGDSKTDIINRALQLYAFVEDIIDNDGEFLVRDKGGEMMKVLITYPTHRHEPREAPASR